MTMQLFEDFFRLLSEGLALTDAELGEDLGRILEALDAEEVRSFQEAGVLSEDEGYVVRLDDGREFQITVVQTRGARPD